MRKAVLFDEFKWTCKYFEDSEDGFICNHPEQEEETVINDAVNEDKTVGCCFCFSCPLGLEAEQIDLTDRENPDAVKDEIDWDGLCSNSEVEEGEILLVDVGDDATDEQKEAVYAYDRYMHRYDKKWLGEHGISNSLKG